MIKPIVQAVYGVLLPLKANPPASMSDALGPYLTRLNDAQGRLTSTQAKTDFGALISAVQLVESGNQAAADKAVPAAINQLALTDCPT